MTNRGRMMKQFGKILKFELKNYLKNKTFVGVTVLLVAVIVVVMFLPRVMEKAGDDGSDDKTAAEDKAVMLIVGDNEKNGNLIKEAFSKAFPDYEIKIADNDIKSIKKQITEGDAECAFVMKSLTSYTYYVDNLSMYDSNKETADELLKEIYRSNAMLKGGLSESQVNTILTKEIESTTKKLGKDQMQYFLYTYIMVFALYMVILLYGQMVATNVASEKSSRAMELLITSAKPVAMMFGKVIASCMAGFIQITAVFGAAVICFNINKSYWADNNMIKSIFDIPADLLVYMLVFFILGFLIYAFLYGAVGSTVSKLEDINTAVMPVSLIFIFGFFVVMFSMSGGSVDTLLVKVCSFIPFTSPMAMFTRIAMTAVPLYEIAISIVILIASVIGIGVISAKIYRVGVLLYGNAPKPAAIIKSIWKK